MSRNLRHKQGSPVPVIKATKTPPNTDESSDDDYCGVDLISDSEDAEPDVEVAEEQAIIASEEEGNDSVPQPEPDDDQRSWAGLDVDERNLEDGQFFQEQIERTVYPDLYTEATAWDGNIRRRVRFDLSDSESNTSDDDNIFPDIFVDQNCLDPTFRQAIENENDTYDPPSDGGSYWDFRSSDPPDANSAECGDHDIDGSIGSSGYETDEGETTEEDLPPAAYKRYVPARSVLRRQSTGSSSSGDVTVVRRSTYRPKLGTWVADGTRPFAVLDNRGKGLVVFRSRINRRYTFDGSTSQLENNVEESETDALDLSPMINNSANLMMSAMCTPDGNHLGSQVYGPPEAFYPFVSIAADGTFIRDSPLSSYDDDDDDDDEQHLNIADLIDFGENSSDISGVEEEEGERSSSTINHPSTPAAPSSTPARPTSEDQMHPLLEHFDRGVVGAFRRHQTHHRLISGQHATPESLAFANPYNHGTLRGIKGGRLAAANTPITPPRRSKVINPESSFSPSITAELRKRKFSGDQFCHKRSRSMN